MAASAALSATLPCCAGRLRSLSHPPLTLCSTKTQRQGSSRLELASALQRRKLRHNAVFASLSAGAGAGASSNFSNPNADANDALEEAAASSSRDYPQEPSSVQRVITWFKRQQQATGELRARVAKLGLSAILTYGFFDGVTYTAAFVLAFLTYERTMGLNPARNLKDLAGVVVLMWAGNNVTRPFRVAAAAALAPAVDKLLNKMQARLRLPNQFAAFVLVVAVVASCCFSIVGLLILSRLR
eukprot:jgi/Chlat1/8575/Chrsp82S07964